MKYLLILLMLIPVFGNGQIKLTESKDVALISLLYKKIDSLEAVLYLLKDRYDTSGIIISGWGDGGNIHSTVKYILDSSGTIIEMREIKSHEKSDTTFNMKLKGDTTCLEPFIDALIEVYVEIYNRIERFHQDQTVGVDDIKLKRIYDHFHNTGFDSVAIDIRRNLEYINIYLGHTIRELFNYYDHGYHVGPKWRYEDPLQLFPLPIKN